MNKTPHCNLLFNGLEVTTSGKVKPCCLFSRYVKDQKGNDYNVEHTSVSNVFYSTDMKQLRNRSLSGEFISECEQCYIEERSGAESRRQRENKRITSYETPVIQQLDIKPGNTCNLKCRICNPEHSSLLNSENRALGLHTVGKKFSWGLNNSTVWDDLKSLSQNLEHIDFMGGEPMLINQHIDFLEHLIHIGRSKDVELNYVSNGTILPDKIEELLPEFKHVNFVLSADGVGGIYEYCRFPSSWDVFARNLQKIKLLSDSMIISYSVSVYSLFGIFDALDYYESVDTITWFNFVYNEDSCITIMPDYYKDMFVQEYQKRKRDSWKLNNVSVDDIVNFMYSSPYDDRRWKMFLANTNQRDVFRKQKVYDVLTWLDEDI